MLHTCVHLQAPFTRRANVTYLCSSSGFFYQKSKCYILVFIFRLLLPEEQMLHTCVHLQAASTRRTNGRSLRSFQKIMLFQKSARIGYKSTFTFSSLKGGTIAQKDRPGFVTRLAFVQLVVTKEAVGQVSLRIIQYSSVSIISPMVHTFLCFDTTRIRKTRGTGVGAF
jgi:hypothetical protein